MRGWLAKKVPDIAALIQATTAAIVICTARPCAGAGPGDHGAKGNAGVAKVIKDAGIKIDN